MAYVENPFKVGQYALCINDNFHVVKTTGDKSKIGTITIRFPKIGEICCIDEILGEFLRFDEYDCNDKMSVDYGWHWWKHINFKPITLEEVERRYSQSAKELSTVFNTVLDMKQNEMKQKQKPIVVQQYCIGSPKMAAVPYIGQQEPIFLGSKEEVENWLSDFWKSAGCKN